MDRSVRMKSTLVIGFACTILFVLLILISLPPMEHLEKILYDYRFKLRGPIKPHENILIAAIDERSIATLGRWPWSRDKIAKLVEKLAAADAEMVVFDIFLTEHEKNDQLLGNAVERAGNVILPIVFDSEERSTLPDNQTLVHSSIRFILFPERFNEYNPVSAKGVLLPVPELLKEAMGLGHISTLPDRDGTFRWENMTIEYNRYLFPSLGLKTAAIYLGIPHEKMIVEATQGVKLGTKRYIPTDQYGRALINFYGPAQTFKYLSISDILEDKINPQVFQGKIVLIGATAAGTYDLKVTPSSPAMPGVEKHANVISSILENRFLKRATFLTNLAILLGTGILFSLLLVRRRAIGATFMTGLFLLTIFASGYYLFIYGGLWINMGYPSINLLLVFITITAFNYTTEEREARKVRTMFSSYVTERVVNELIANPGMAKLGGERREVTVLFSDIRGFTSFSEKHTPEEVVAKLNEYLAAMTDVIFRWEGTLDKFVGDAILAFWGAPMRQENHAELATRCALNMVKRLKELQVKWQSEGKPILDSGIGLNTGEVLVGNIGAEGKKMDYTVIGDHVNLGARVESLTRSYDTPILMTEFTLDRIETLINRRHIGHVSLKGREKVVLKGLEKMVGLYEIHSLKHGSESKMEESEGKGDAS